MIIQKSFLFIIIFIITFYIASIDLISAQTETDSLHKEIKHLKSVISKLDSTITKLQSEHQTIIALTEKDINTAQNLINVSQTVTEIIAVMLAIFSVVGGILISRLMKQSRQVRKEHRILKRDWDTSRKEIEKIKNTIITEGKELIQILFYVTEGDNRLYEKTNESIEFYKEALKIRENNPQVYAKLGRAYYLLKEYNDAIIYFEKALSVLPNNISILNGLARVYSELRHYDKAEIYYKKTLSIDQNDNIALWGLGHVYLNTYKFDEAEILYQKSRLTDSEFYSNFNLGFIYCCKKDSEKYLKYAERALYLLDTKTFRKNVDDWIIGRKAILFIILKKFMEAKELLIKLLNEYKDSAAINFVYDRFKILNDVYKEENIEELMKILEIKNNQ